MSGNVIDLSKARRISQETFDRWTRRLKPIEGDLLLAREAPVGPVVRMPPGGSIAAGQRTMHLRADPAVVHPRFLFYMLISPVVQDRLRAMAMGSTVPHLRVADVKAFILPELPQLSDQDLIQELLGALDDKIAANVRTVALVQELSDAMFTAASAGLTPGDMTFADLAQIGGGGTPRTAVDKYWDGDVAWATPTDVTGLGGPYLGSTSRRISAAGLKSCSSPMYPAGSIFMTSRATIGAFAVAGRPMAVNQGFIVVNPRDHDLAWWIFHEMRSRVDEFVTEANGATFLELGRGKFSKFRVRLADEDVMRRFNSEAKALHAAARNALAESVRLAELRDTLLPHLMSGRLRVKDAEKHVEDVL